MKLGIICGSHRHKSQSRKVAEYISGRLKQASPAVEVWLYDLAEHPLPFWDEGVWAGEEKWKKIWGPISTELKSCDGFVVISPEWSGMATPALKNFFLLSSCHELGHKPGLIVTVSSGMGGSNPNQELRVSSYKNTRICYIPDHLIIRNVEKLLNDFHEVDVTPEDQYIRGRIDYSLNVLKQYAGALRGVRESGVIDYKAYPNGM